VKNLGVVDQKTNSILIVDDDLELRTLLGQLLCSQGYGVLEAGNGKEALIVLESALPSIILLDLVMPVMDGSEFIRFLNSDPVATSKWNKIPIIIYSASVEQFSELSSYTHAQLQKPLNISVLIETIDAILARS